MVTPNAPNETGGPEGVDPDGRTLPPYQGRRTTADVGGPEQASRDGAKVGGATGPVENDEMAAADLDDDRAGPAHEPGTARAGDKP